jgi:hypothetical protein
MRKLIILLCLPLLLSCGEEKKYKVENNKGETFIIKASGYYIDNGNAAFVPGKGYIQNVKSIIVVE